MEEAAKIVSAAIMGFDGTTVMVDNTAYTIMSPTIERIAGAAYYLSDVTKCSCLADMIEQMKSLESASKALAWFVCDEKETRNEMAQEVARLSEVLAKGSLPEILHGLSVAFSLINVENFKKLSTLARNVGMLTAKPRPQEMRVS